MLQGKSLKYNFTLEKRDPWSEKKQYAKNKQRINIFYSRLYLLKNIHKIYTKIMSLKFSDIMDIFHVITIGRHLDQKKVQEE